jgi:hypothetical protein
MIDLRGNAAGLRGTPGFLKALAHLRSGTCPLLAKPQIFKDVRDERSLDGRAGQTISRGMMMVSAVRNMIGATALGLCAGLGLPAQAAYTVTLLQQGPDVVATGTGSIDLTGLIFVGSSGGDEAIISGGLGIIVVGPVPFTPSDEYGGYSGPIAFGNLGALTATSGSGDRVGIDQDSGELFVPAGYVSGSSLSISDAWDNRNFGNLGVTPGTYVWTWGSGPNADSFTLQIGAVPEPASLPLLALGLAGLGLVLRVRRA